jgi:hypothetical protein
MPDKPSDVERACQTLRMRGQSYKQIAYEFNKESGKGDWTEAKVRNAVQKCLSFDRIKLRLENAIDHDAKVFDNFESAGLNSVLVCVHSSHVKGPAVVYRYPDTQGGSNGLLDALEAMRRHNHHEHDLV